MQTVCLQQLLKALKTKSALVIDVRGVQEIASTGSIKGALNIPLPDLGTALTMSAEHFASKYSPFTKPSFSDPIIFSCKCGGRSSSAVSLATSHGYTNVASFCGGWDEYGKWLQTNADQ